MAIEPVTVEIGEFLDMRVWRLIATITVLITGSSCQTPCPPTVSEVVTPETHMFRQCEELCKESFGVGIVGFMDYTGIFCACQDGTTYGDINAYEYLKEGFHGKGNENNTFPEEGYGETAAKNFYSNFFRAI